MIDDVAPADAWTALSTDPQARLVDVRTDAEWAYVGSPDLQATGQEPVLIPWQVFPAMQVNGGFVQALKQAGLTPEHKLYFLCRSGIRSLAAAKAAQAEGFAQAFNVAGGFEGPSDGDGHRGTVAGWKVAGLPWQQR